MRGAPIASDVAAAVRASRLGAISGDVIAAILQEGQRARVEPGETIHGQGESEAHVELIVSGLIRALISAPDGRTLTIRYCRRGDILGVATLFTDAGRPFAVQALTGAEILRLPADHLRHLALRDTQVADAFLRETSDRVMEYVSELDRIAFAPVPQRLARHLLDIAGRSNDGGELVASITQQELADAGGTVREVVVRTLREFRSDGLVRTGPHAITILRPERLLALARGSGWNVGS